MDRWSWSVSSTTVRIPTARVMPRRRAPSSKSRLLSRNWRSVGTSSAGSDIDGVHATGRSPRFRPSSSMPTGSSCRRTPLPITFSVIRSCSLRGQYESVDKIILSIDGLQPEKGHETLYVVRELTQKRVWFAEPLISATNEEVQRLIAKAKEWAASLGKTVVLWVSDKQDAFVKGIAAEFPGVTHRYCDNHFLRDAAKPVLEADSHAKVQMRRKVRGLRKIEQAVLKHERESAEQNPAINDPEATLTVSTESVNPKATEVDSACAVVLAYCTAVRGILNDDQGGPLNPPGLRMTAALNDVRDSIQRNLAAKKGGLQKSNLAAWPRA